MQETWGERLDQEIAEGKAVRRGESQKAREEEPPCPDGCNCELHGLGLPPSRGWRRRRIWERT